MSQKLKLVFTGTGACATGAYAQYATEAGLRCGHEKIFGPMGYTEALEKLANPRCKPGESSWLAAPYLDREELDDAVIVHLIRHPAKVISTMSRVKVGTGRYWLFGAVFCPRMLEYGRSWDGFAYRYLMWNKLIELRLVGRDHVTFNVEGDPLDLLEELKRRGLDLHIDRDNPLYKRRGINAHRPEFRKKPQFQFTPNKLRNPDLRADLEQMAERYGYDW